MLQISLRSLPRVLLQCIFCPVFHCHAFSYPANAWKRMNEKKKRSLNCVIVIYEELFSVQHCNEPPLRLCSIVGSFALTQQFFATLLFFLCEKEEKKKMEHHRANVTTRNNLIEHLWVLMQNRNERGVCSKVQQKKAR